MGSVKIRLIFGFQFLEGHYHGNISSNDRPRQIYFSFWPKLLN